MMALALVVFLFGKVGLFDFLPFGMCWAKLKRVRRSLDAEIWIWGAKVGAEPSTHHWWFVLEGNKCMELLQVGDKRQSPCSVGLEEFSCRALGWGGVLQGFAAPAPACSCPCPVPVPIPVPAWSSPGFPAKPGNASK